MTPNIPTIPDTESFERAVMSCCIRDYHWPHAYTEACRFIQPKHFYDPNKSKAWKIMGDMDTQPDELTLSSELGIEIGEVLNWTNATETSSRVHYYAEGVQKAWTRRAAEDVGNMLKDSVNMGEDPKTALSSASKRISDTLSDQGSSFEPAGEGVEEVLEHCFKMDDGEVSYLNTGFPDLDKVLGGFKPGEMAVLAGRPSNGKTALALSIAALVAKAGGRVLFASLEMTKHQLLKRLIHAEARVPIINRPNQYNSEDREKLQWATEEIKKWPLLIDQSSGITIPYLSAKTVSEKTRSGLDLLIVDYLGIMSAEGKDKYEKISNISRGMQTLAKKLEAPILTLSQQNRESEKDNQPKMSHLKDSGDIEQDADQVIMLKRMEEGSFQQVETMEAHVVKNRNGGTGKVPLTFCRSFAKYESYATEPKTFIS